jgi:glycerophosphoryl diester phosphodiesterase
MASVKIIGHRGAMAHELENSLRSFEKAIELGCDMVELDARTTEDGELVVLHDENMGSVSNGFGKISNLSLKEIKTFKLKNHEQIPTLKEVLEKVKGRCDVNIHIKDANAVLRSCNIANDMGMMNDVVFTAIHGPWLIDIKSKYPHARVTCVSRDKSQDIIRIAQSLKAEGINPASRIATKKFIQEAHEAGLQVNVWTVNFSWQMKKFIGWGVDGIITNRPDVLVRVIEKMDVNK